MALNFIPILEHFCFIWLFFLIYKRNSVVKNKFYYFCHLLVPTSLLSALILFFQDNVAELSSVLDRHSGILGYISKFWRGFFPLLMVELEDHEQSFNEDSQEVFKHTVRTVNDVTEVSPQNPSPSPEWLHGASFCAIIYDPCCTFFVSFSLWSGIDWHTLWNKSWLFLIVFEKIMKATPLINWRSLT